jgi:peptidoglycan/LPS O-acetylase OafA/YrhL
VTPARPRVVALIALAATALSWFGLDLWGSRGGTPPPLPWTTALGTLILGAGVVAAGLPVRRWVAGRRERPLDPLLAARTVVLAKAAAYGGALLTGWYAGQALILLPDPVEVRRTRLVVAGICTLVAIALAGCGLLVQRWCRVPPSDDDGDGGGDDDDER